MHLIQSAICTIAKITITGTGGSFMPYRQYKAKEPVQDIVIPDTCMDIIFTNKLFISFCKPKK